MRLSSGFSNTLLVLLPLIIASCASAPPATSPDELFQLEGSLRVEGDQPFDRVILLSDPEDVRWNLDPGKLEADLSLLDGYRVVLTCRGIPKDSERDALVEAYSLVPPEGMVAELGILTTADESIFLNAGGDRFKLEGPLKDALKAFADHRAWVWGHGGPEGVITMSGYEVLGPQ
jgi:hypothetical protein